MSVFRESINRIQELAIKWLLVMCFGCAPLANSVAQSLTIDETDVAITIKQGKQTVVVYNKVSPAAPEGVDPVYERSGLLHPVKTPDGFTVTEMFPRDHLHQHGIFSAWVRTTYDGETIDFWNLAARTGRVLHDRVVSITKNDARVGFEVELIHRIESTPPIDVLRERWKITANATDGSYHSFDLETTQAAITEKPLLINEYHYGGIALRGPTSWLSQKRNENQPAEKVSVFLNDLGSNREKGNHEHAKWVALSGPNGSKTACVAVLSHADNFRSPQAARLHPNKPYFCFAPCFDGEFTIDRQHPYKARFRYFVTDSPPDPVWLNRQWDQWCGGKH